MKKTAFWCLLLICCSCIAFTGGFFIGRNYNRTPVQVSKLPAATASSENTAKVNINTATIEELQTLPDIGPLLAQRIIDYRQQHGPFTKPADLSKVEGIGIKTLEAILDHITTGG
jgi:comEA protein